MTNASGETVVNELRNTSCLNCISECNKIGSRIANCRIDKSRRNVILYHDQFGELYVCDNKEKTSKNFLAAVELIKHSRRSIIERHASVKQATLRITLREFENFKHNIVHINSDAINEFYAFITQDELIKNYRGLQDIIANKIKANPEEVIELTSRLAKYNLNMKTELAVMSKLNTMGTAPNWGVANPRDAVMSSVYMTYPQFKKRQVYVHVGEYRQRFNIDYEAVQVVSFYIVENASKYTERDSRVEIYFCHEDGILKICFKMHSLYVAEEEEVLIFNEGFQGEQARKSKRGGKGIGLYRAKRLAKFIGGDVTMEAGDPPVLGLDGLYYADNVFTLSLPLS